MRYLYIDTSSSYLYSAILEDNNLISEVKEEYGQSLSEVALPKIVSMFTENNIEAKDIDKIIVVNGPGSFTGIRIGLSIAKTMAYALKIDINTISSLTAYLVSNDTKEKRKAVIEDSKGYYVGAFDENDKPIMEEYYTKEDKLDLPCVPKKILVSKIFKYCENMPSENPHHIKANYVKEIEVKYDK